jgi:hypothetical protein
MWVQRGSQAELFKRCDVDTLASDGASCDY